MSSNTPTIAVIGSGLAGLSAGIQAARSGAQVIILEKEKICGGNTLKATSGINASGTTSQYERGILDSFIFFGSDTLSAGGKVGDRRLIFRLTRESQSAVEFLETFGLSLTEIAQCGGHSSPRTHRIAPSADEVPVPLGFMIVKQLLTAISEIPAIQIITSAEVTAIQMEQNESIRCVTGIHYILEHAKSVNLATDAVIVTTGGMHFDRSGGSLLAEYASNLCSLATTSGPHADGKGMRMCRSLGAELVHMDKVQVHPTGFVDKKDPQALTKMLCPETIRGCGAIMINSNGCRFANELSTRKALTESILSHGNDYSVRLESGREQKVAFLLLNEEVSELFGTEALTYYIEKGLVTEDVDLSAFCLRYGIAQNALDATMREYCTSAAAGVDRFGKVTFPVKTFRSDQKLFAAIVTPVLHYSMGGIKIDSSAQVQCIRSDGVREPVDRLFAAGECTGGLHGSDRLAGNSLLECVVFGRIAGERAATLPPRAKISTWAGLAVDKWTPLRLRHRVLTDPLADPLEGGLYEISFELPCPLDTLHILPGSSLEVRAIINGSEVIRQYSPAAGVASRGHLDLWLKLSPSRGNMSRYLYFLPVGHMLDFRVQLGTALSFPLTSYSQHVVLIAGGAGISPLLQLLRDFVAKDVPYASVLLLWGVVRSKDLLYYKATIDEIAAKHPDKISVEYFAEDAVSSNHKTGVTAGILSDSVLQQRVKNLFSPTLSDAKLVICGSHKMCQSTRNALKSLGFKDNMIYSYR